MLEMVLASTNPDKVEEIQNLFKNMPIKLIPQNELNVPEIEETGSTFFENAIIKARHASQYADLPALADDSGLVIPALNNAPGVYSARYAGVHASNSDRINKVLTELNGIKDVDRTAFFHCVLALMSNETDPAPIVCHGIWEGEILFEPQGELGFGYDPIFYVSTHRCSAAELDMREKNRISHRGIAFSQLVDILKQVL